MSEMPDTWPREVHQPCTGIAAVWCPIHGTCTCRPFCPTCDSSDQVVGGTILQWSCRTGCGEFESDGRDMNRPDCPLHSESSDHAEGE